MTPLVLLSAAAVVTLWARVLYLRRLNQGYRKELRRQETHRRIAAVRASGQLRRAR